MDLLLDWLLALIQLLLAPLLSHAACDKALHPVVECCHLPMHTTPALKRWTNVRGQPAKIIKELNVRAPLHHARISGAQLGSWRSLPQLP